MTRIPDAGSRGRKLTDEISTLNHRMPGIVEARLVTARTYTHPDEAPSYARLTYHKGRWNGDIKLQEFASTELAALEALAETLYALGFDEQVVLTHTIAELRAQQPGAGK
jgi:hypothetical protein